MSRRADPRYCGELGFGELRAELERLLHEMLAAADALSRQAAPGPEVDVVEGPETICILVAVPGVAARELEVEIHAGTLRVRGRKRRARPPGRSRFHCLERTEGPFERTVEVRGPLDLARARAVLADGLLRVELPRIEERRSRRMTIPVEDAEAGGDG